MINIIISVSLNEERKIDKVFPPFDEKQFVHNDIFDTLAVWNQIRDFQHISSHDEAKATGLNLSPGKTYRFKIKICAITTCYSPLVSDGVTVLANSPVTGQLTLEHFNLTQGGGSEQVRDSHNLIGFGKETRAQKTLKL